MYIKLTKLDNSPIWLNAAFIVTVEPRKGGGAIVVPIGDGLDYDVRETPEAVLAMLEGAPTAAVVPVPPPKSLAPTPEDVSAESENLGATDVAELKPEAQAKPVKRTARGKGKSKVEKSAPAEPSEPAVAASDVQETAPVEAAVAESEAERPVDPLDVFASSLPAPAHESAKSKKGVRRSAKTAGSDVLLGDEQLERLRKLAPGSVKKLANTLVSQFRIDDTEGAITALVESRVVEIDKDRVLWR